MNSSKRKETIKVCANWASGRMQNEVLVNKYSVGVLNIPTRGELNLE
jgi:hypothetical protein